MVCVHRAPVTPVPHTYIQGVYVKIMYECMYVCVYVICNNVGGTGTTLFRLYRTPVKKFSTKSKKNNQASFFFVYTVVTPLSPQSFNIAYKSSAD